jgi:hypothetical protein
VEEFNVDQIGTIDDFTNSLQPGVVSKMGLYGCCVGRDTALGNSLINTMANRLNVPGGTREGRVYGWDHSLYYIDKGWRRPAHFEADSSVTYIYETYRY